MWLLGKPLSEIQPVDIARLIEDKVTEGIKHDYKRDLPNFDSDEDKKEFLADVSAFANKLGGTILYGIEEEKEHGKNVGYPKYISGIGNPTPGELSLRIQQICQTGLQPALTNLRPHFLPIEEKWILMLGIPRSLLSPHMIWFKKNGKFYSRNDGGKYQMEIHEIKQAFLEADEWMRMAEEFRMERVRALVEGKALVDIGKEKVYVIHIIPIGRQRETVNINHHRNHVEGLVTHPSKGWPSRFNIDGLIAHSGSPKWFEYGQFYRNGALEVLLQLEMDENVHEDLRGQVIDGHSFEFNTMWYIHSYMQFINTAEIAPPIVIFITLLNVKGCTIAGSHHLDRLSPIDFEDIVFDRDKILSDGIVLESVDTEILPFTQPIFDMIWQSAGYKESPLSEERGKRWAGK